VERHPFDLVVIGAGPGGYVAAIQAAQRGAKVLLIDRGPLGGTCLNIGCIPTKTLLASAEVLHIVKRASEYGIDVGSTSCDYRKMKERKDGVVQKMRSGLTGLLQGNKITVWKGQAEFLSPFELKVRGENSGIVEAKQVIIATGSEPLDIPAFPCDHKKVFNSTSILDLTQLPKKLAVVGGGYIGCEFASLFAELGVEVVILEALPKIVMLQGNSVSAALTEAFKKRSIQVMTEVMVERIEDLGVGLKIHLKEKEPILADIALISVGRKVVTDGLKLEAAGIATDAKGAIPVDERMQTSVPGIYAIGDVTGKMMLAHVASHQGVVAAINATGGQAVMHYDSVPAVIFTHPEIACVGMTLEEAKGKGLRAITGRFPFQALGKAVATIETEGFAEVILEEGTGRILGAQVVGKEAASLIAEMALAIANELTADCIGETIHAHPTLPEALHEATLLALGTPLHLPPKPKKVS